MSRSALLAFVFVAAGLSGCASPARVIDQSASRVVVAIPDNTNTWPFYYRDEAERAANEYIHDPVLVTSARVKVGEQLTNTQDTTRHEFGKDKKAGEVVSSTNTTAVSDKYEYHLEFRSRGPVTVSTSTPGVPGNPITVPGTTPPVTPAGGLMPQPGMPETGRQPPPGVPQTAGGSAGELPGSRFLQPANPTTNLPPTNIGSK